MTFFLLFFLTWTAYGTSDDARSIIDRTFPGAQRIDTVALAKPVLVISTRDSVAGYVVIDNARGKDQPITYLVATGTDLRVRAVEILAYREAYGGEVRNESWRRQFDGKSPEDELRPARDIRNITGATISARAITFGVKNILNLLRQNQSRLPRGRAGR